MRTYLIVLASAALLAALVTELSFRLFPGDHFVLLLLSFLALAINGLFNARLAVRGTPAGTVSRAPSRAAGGRGKQEMSERIISKGREEGVIKWFDDGKGFGFIIRDSGGEIFVHKRSIRGGGKRLQLHDGRKVSFAVAENEKGLHATDVTAH